MRRIRLFLIFTALLLAQPLSSASASNREAAAQAEDASAPNLYVLAIGINEYRQFGRRNPIFARKDAIDLAKTLEEVGKAKFERVIPKVLKDKEATRASIQEAFREIIGEARPKDTFVFLFSGHGLVMSGELGSQSQFYLVPSDFVRSRDSLREKGIPAAQLQYWLIQVEAQHQLVILDSHKSGTGFKTFTGYIEKENKRMEGLSARDIVILSVTDLSFEFSNLENGLLTFTVLKGLRGGAALESGDISVKKLASYVEEQSSIILGQITDKRVLEIIKDHPEAGKPAIFIAGSDFILGSTASRVARAKEAASAAHATAARTHQLSNERGRVSEPKQDSEYIPLAQCVPLSTRKESALNNGRQGKDFALFIAIDEYKFQNAWDTLVNPIFDATTLADVLNTRYGFETEVLRNPSSDCIFDAFKRYKFNKNFAPDSQLLVFFAGHGFYTGLKNGDMGVIVPAEGPPPGRDNFGREYISHAEIRRDLSVIPCRHILLVLDSCFSGTSDHSTDSVAGDPPDSDNDGPEGDSDMEFVDRSLRFKTRRYLTSGGKEYVPDGRQGEHSPFARKLLEALDRNIGESRFVTFNELRPILARALPKPSEGWWGGNDERSEFFFFTKPLN